MRKILLFTTFILLLIMPFVLADIPPLPNEKTISINHQITNINSYSDYIFFATADNENGGPGFSMCPLEIVGSDGLVKYNHYKLCSISVYAVKKSDMSENQLKAMDETQLESLVSSSSTVKLFTGLSFSKVVADSSSESEENVSHSIDASKLNANNNNQNSSESEENVSHSIDAPKLNANNNNQNQNNQNNNNNNQVTVTCPIGSTNEAGVCKKTLSNGQVADIKIMPETASAKAVERLGELGFSVQLKETDNKAVYEVSGDKQGKLFGLFKVKGKVSVDVDSQTGEVVKVNRPWWSFLASGI